MWVVSGPFDNDDENKLDFQKHKLLKPGNKYVIGRKGVHLNIKHIRISHTHVVLEVADYTEDDVENPNFIPKIKVHNPCKAKRTIHHEDESQLILNGQGGSAPIRPGDTLELVHAIQVTFKWEKVACCCPPAVASVDARDCAKLGISLLWKPHPDVNYHLTPTYTLTPAIASSLLTAAQFAKPTWLTDLIERYSSSDESEAKEWVMPSIAKYRPTFSPALPSSLKNHRSWEPNEARAKMLKGYRVIFVGERGREVNEEYKELVKYGESGYECCAVEGGRTALHAALAKAKGKGKTVVLIANQSAMTAAVGEDGWKELADEAASFQLRFINVERLVLAVAHVDLSHLDCTLTTDGSAPSGESLLPDVILNTHPSEPTMAPPHVPAPEAGELEIPTVRKAARRGREKSPEPAVSNEPSTSSKPAVEEDEIFIPKRPLVRRAPRKPTSVGTNDPSVVEGSSTTGAKQPSSALADDEIFIPKRPLKRRRGTSQQPSEPAAPSQLVGSVLRVDEEEPPHKKYKDLFEASDPDKIAQSLGDHLVAPVGSSLGGSLTQAETLVATQDDVQATRPLEAVPEEEEESTPGASLAAGTQAQTQSRKRRVSDEDVEMEDVDTRPAKRRADTAEPVPEAGPSTQAPESSAGRAGSKAPSSKVFANASNKAKAPASQKGAVGAAAGKPDQDDAFLKAVASTKRGKKHEDEFDREFNNLRIARPDLQREEAEQAWAVLDDFGGDAGVRGNFMVVVEMEVFKKEETPLDVVRTHGTRADWEGRPNYKKFKKRAPGERPKPVELFINDDEGLGATWNTKSSQSQSQEVQEAGSSLKPKRREPTLLDSDSDVEEVTRQKPTTTQTKTKPPSQRAGTAQPTRPLRATQTRSQKKAQPLFIESDEDEPALEPEPEPEPGINVEGEEASLAAVEKELAVEESQTVSETLRSHPRSQPAKPKPGTRRKGAPVLQEDSDEDDMAFKGFGARRKGRR